MAYIGTQPRDIRSFGKADFSFTATQGQTVFTGADDHGKTLAFTVDQIQVYVNGIRIDNTDYVLTNNNTVTLSLACNADDIINVVALRTDIPNNDYVPPESALITNGVGHSGLNTASPVATLHISDIGTTGPALHIEGGSATEGDITVPHTEVLQVGHWNTTTNTFTERMRIDSSGNVGIGTASPSFPLEVRASSGDADFRIMTEGTAADDDALLRLQIGGTTGDCFIFFGDSGDTNSGMIAYKHASDRMEFTVAAAERMRLESDGDLHVDGNVIAYSTTISDERLKTDIERIDGALDKVCALSGYTFTYKHDGKASAGVVAQEVEKVLPSAVIEKELAYQGNDDAYKIVQYDQLHGLLIEAIKELKAEIEELKNGITK